MALFEIRNLTFTYPEAKTPALQEVNVAIEQGEFIVICGKSGCGKTTLLRHFKTALTPYGTRSGEIRFLGDALEQVSVRTQASEIGYVLQSPDNQIVTDKVWHELAFGLENLGYDQQTIRLRVAEMASFFGIQNWFAKNVEELGTTVIIIEHRLEEVFPMADKVLVLEEGRQILYDEPRQVGKALAGNDLFLAMPSPVQIYDGTGQVGTCPLTVCEGRNWLKAHFEKEQSGFCETEKEKSTKGKDEVVIEAKEVWFRYEKEMPDVVKNLSLQVKKGELFCMLGGNGTGKSTTLSLLSGIRRPYRGKILLKGKDIRKRKEKELFHGLIGVLPQNPQSLFVGNTVREDLWEMFSGFHIQRKKEYEKQMERVIEDTQIGHLLDMHPYDLSGGEQQRAALAKVLLLEPEILLLDEPTKGLDGFYKQKLADIFERLKKRGVTILMVSHDIEFCASYGDTCAMFFDGSVITSQNAKAFFVGNSFYTTAANRMARQLYPDAVTVKEVIEACSKNRRQE